jgi:hypothetical protein
MLIERALDLVDIGPLAAPPVAGVPGRPPPVAKFRMVSGLFSAHRVLAGRLTCLREPVEVLPSSI